MEIKVTQLKSWQILAINGRVDALNSRVVVEGILNLVNGGNSKIVVDLTEAQFLSLPTIKFFGNTARMLSTKGGFLAMVGANERTRRHIEIFAGFEIQCYGQISQVEWGPKPKARSEHIQGGSMDESL